LRSDIVQKNTLLVLVEKTHWIWEE
jgi:hypothetical protein